MSITIEKVRAFLKWLDGPPGTFCPDGANKRAIANLAISQHEELETLRAQLAEKDIRISYLAHRLEEETELNVSLQEQLAEKDAMLEKCVNDTYEHIVILCDGERVEYEETKHPEDRAYNLAIDHVIERIRIDQKNCIPVLPTTTQDVIDDSPSVIGPPAPMPTAADVRNVIAKVRNEALEEAAQKCDESAETWLESFKQNGVSDARSRSFECENLAEVIRALKTEVN
jgi:hypothetical protein